MDAVGLVWTGKGGASSGQVTATVTTEGGGQGGAPQLIGQNSL